MKIQLKCQNLRRQRNFKNQQQKFRIYKKNNNFNITSKTHTSQTNVRKFSGLLKSSK